MSAFNYKKILVLGATSGIGQALATKFIQQGKSVIAVGRRQENLDSFVKASGSLASSFAFDITKLADIPKFAEQVIKAHPDLDCVFLNSGIQRKLDFLDPSSIDLDAVELELTTNYTSYIHLIKAFLPHLLASKNETSLIFTTSGLALVPLHRCGNYCASKAALHQLILTLRDQLKATKVNVIEIFPPAVQTELHDSKHQPDIENGGSIGMPLDAFLADAWAGLEKGENDIPVGAAKSWYDDIDVKRQDLMHKMNAHFAK